MYLIRPMIADPAGINYFQSVETELGRVSHIAKQTLGYYRENAAASSASLGEIVLHAITIYEPRCTAAGIEIKKTIGSSRKIVHCPLASISSITRETWRTLLPRFRPRDRGHLTSNQS
jgi:hypothetical protein